MKERKTRTLLAETLKAMRDPVRIYPVPQSPKVLYGLDSRSYLVEMEIEDVLDDYIEEFLGR